MLNAFLRKAGTTLSGWRPEHREPHLDPDSLNLLNSLIDWRISIELARREAEGRAILAEAFADGPRQDDEVTK